MTLAAPNQLGPWSRWAEGVLAGVSSPQEQRQARLALGTTFGLAAVVVSGTVLRLLIGDIAPTALAVIAGTFLALLAVPFLLRRGAVNAAANVCTMAFLILVLGAGWSSGGLQAPVFLLLPTVPMLATFLIGARAGIKATAVLLAFVIFLAFLGPTGPEDAPWRESAELDVWARALMCGLALLVAGLFAVATESQRRQSEAERRRSHDLYQRLFKQSKDVVAVTTPDGEVVDVNQAGLDLYGFDSWEEMKSFDLRQLYVNSENRDRLRRRVEKYGFARSYESKQRTPDGREIDVQGTTSEIQDSQGEVSHWLTILRDVTEERRNENDRARMFAALERKNAELEHFASTVAHDLRGPLFTLQGFLELLEAGEVYDGEDMRTIMATAERMSTLLDELLEHARLGHDSSPWGTVSMTEIAHQVVADLGGRLRSSALKVEISADLPPAHGDKTLIRILLQNLIENAVKFSGDGSRILIDHTEEQGLPVYRVADDGPGIPPNEREQVFGLFFRRHGQDVAGTGIGLAAVAKIAALHGGRAWVAEHDPPGATLCFTLQPGPESESDPL